MISFMACFHVPYLHYFHKFMDIRVMQMGITHPQIAVITKVLLDQGIAAPIYAAFFLFTTTMMEGISVSDAKQRMQANWWDMLTTCWMVWGPGHCITYSLPFKYRSIWCDCVRVYWGTLMSYYANRDDDDGNKLTDKSSSQRTDSQA